MFKYILRYLKNNEFVDEAVSFNVMYVTFRKRQKEFGQVECICIDEKGIEHCLM